MVGRVYVFTMTSSGIHTTQYTDAMQLHSTIILIRSEIPMRREGAGSDMNNQILIGKDAGTKSYKKMIRKFT